MVVVRCYGHNHVLLNYKNYIYLILFWINKIAIFSNRSTFQNKSKVSIRKFDQIEDCLHPSLIATLPALTQAVQLHTCLTDPVFMDAKTLLNKSCFGKETALDNQNR